MNAGCLTGRGIWRRPSWGPHQRVPHGRQAGATRNASGHVGRAGKHRAGRLLVDSIPAAARARAP